MHRSVAAALLVFAAAWLAHGASLGADWIGDDARLVRDNPVVARGASGIGAAFGPDAWTGEAEPGVWRPLTIVSFCLEAPLWIADRGDPPRPFGFHLTNLFLHGIASVLLFGLARRLAPGHPVLTLGAALLFAVHPLHAQAVGTLAGRADLLAAVLALVAARLWIAASDGRAALLPLGVLAFFLALLAKETVVGLPLALLLLELGRGATGRGRRLAPYLLLLVPVALWALRWPWPAPDPRSGLEGLGAAAVAFFVPVGHAASPLTFALGAGLLLAGAAVVLGWLGGGPVRLALAATTLLWGAALLVSPAGAPLLPGFAYAPGIGLCVIGGALLRVLWVGVRVPQLGRAAATVLLTGLCILTWAQERALADVDAYERALIDAHPEDDALLLRHAGRLRRDAVSERRRAATRALDPQRRDALVARTTRMLADAGTYVRAVIRRADPDAAPNELAADAYRELGFVLQEESRAPEAVGALRQSLYLEPWLQENARREDMPPARRALVLETLRRLARSEEAVGEIEQAAVHVEHAAELAPRDAEVLHVAGRTLSRAGEHARAQTRLAQALELATDPELRTVIERELEAAREAGRRAADARLQAGRQAVEDGRYAEAVSALQEALAADPTLLRAYLELALHLGQWFGRYAQAYEVISAGERMLRELAYPPQDPWWGRFAKLREQLEKMEAEDLAEERGEIKPPR